MTYFSLSSSGLKNLAQLPENESFTFVTKSNKYKTSFFVASFISPKATKILLGDYSAHRLNLNLSDDDKEFNGIINLARGEEILINEKNVEFYLAAAEDLENSELANACITYQKGIKITKSNVIARIIQKSKYLSEFKEEIDYIAANFYEFTSVDLKALECSIIEDILNNQNLVIISENKLMKFILEMGERYYSLLKHVEFSNLSSRRMNQFIEAVSLEQINAIVWKSICKRLVMPLTDVSEILPITNHTYQQNGMKSTLFNYTTFDPFGGIISFLAASLHNIIGRQILTITSSSSGDCLPVTKIIDYARKDWWYSQNYANSWVKLDFHNKTIRLNGYTIRSGGQNCTHLREWVLEGSNDDYKWDILDERNNRDLLGDREIRHYPIHPRKDYRYFRLRQTGVNHLNNHQLCLANIELFGYIYEPI